MFVGQRLAPTADPTRIRVACGLDGENLGIETLSFAFERLNKVLLARLRHPSVAHSISLHAVTGVDEVDFPFDVKHERRQDYDVLR